MDAKNSRHPGLHPESPTVWELAWPFCMQADKCMNDCGKAFIRMSWRVYHRNLVKCRLEKSFFSPKQVIKQIAWLYCSRLRAYKCERSLFYRRRLHTPMQHRLPKKLKGKVGPIGSLDLVTGEVKIKQEIVDILKEQGVW